METRLVRLRRFDPKRGYVLRRYTYAGIKFHPGRGWYCVDEATANYLRGVHTVERDPHSPLAFDVCTLEEAQAIDEQEEKTDRPVRALDAIELSPAREGAPAPHKRPGRRPKAAPAE